MSDVSNSELAERLALRAISAALDALPDDARERVIYALYDHYGGSLVRALHTDWADQVVPRILAQASRFTPGDAAYNAGYGAGLGAASYLVQLNPDDTAQAQWEAPSLREVLALPPSLVVFAQAMRAASENDPQPNTELLGPTRALGAHLEESVAELRDAVERGWMEPERVTRAAATVAVRAMQLALRIGGVLRALGGGAPVGATVAPAEASPETAETPLDREGVIRHYHDFRTRARREAVREFSNAVARATCSVALMQFGDEYAIMVADAIPIAEMAGAHVVLLPSDLFILRGGQ